MGAPKKERPASKIALGGIIAAMMAAIMLGSYFPYLTYAIPALAGMLVIVPLIEISAVWAFMTYLAASAVVLITAENEAKLLFVLFFGFYPIIKAKCEKPGKRIPEYILKFLVFNAAVAAYVAASVWLLGIPLAEFTSSQFGAFTAPILLVGGNVVFFIYDLGLTRVISAYWLTLHHRVKKLLK